MAKHKRNLFLNVNENQIKLLVPFFVSCFCVCLIGLFCLNYFLIFEKQIIQVFNMTIPVDFLKTIIPLLLVLIMAMMIFMIFWAYYITNKMLGSYNRILKELDSILEGKKKELLSTRKGDQLFEELLLRINALIKKLP